MRWWDGDWVCKTGGEGGKRKVYLFSYRNGKGKREGGILVEEFPEEREVDFMIYEIF